MGSIGRVNGALGILVGSMGDLWDVNGALGGIYGHWGVWGGQWGTRRTGGIYGAPEKPPRWVLGPILAPFPPGLFLPGSGLAAVPLPSPAASGNVSRKDAGVRARCWHP